MDSGGEMKRYPQLEEKQRIELKKFRDQKERSGREVQRTHAVLLLDKNENIETIIELTGYQRRWIFTLRQRYLILGLRALIDKRKGKPKELLTKRQRQQVIFAVTKTSPSNHGYDAGYWTAPILGNFILQKYKVQFRSKTSYYLVFKQAKFTYHEPGHVYQKRDEAEVCAWEKQIGPKLKAAWKDKNTIILAEDEMSLSTQTTVQKVWLPEGEYPKITISAEKESRSVFGFLNLKTGTCHAFKRHWQNMHILAEILPQIRSRYPSKKLFIIWDQAGWHRGSLTQEWIRTDSKTETTYFPRSAPDENPQEHVWKQGRSQVTHNNFIENIDTATEEFVSYLNRTKFAYSLLGFSALS